MDTGNTFKTLTLTLTVPRTAIQAHKLVVFWIFYNKHVLSSNILSLDSSDWKSNEIKSLECTGTT